MSDLKQQIEALKAEEEKIRKSGNPKLGSPEDHRRLREIHDKKNRLYMSQLDGLGILDYEANNSGGRWWLKDADWKALEDAGWTVHWICRTQRDHSDVGGSKEARMIDSGRHYSDDPTDMLRPMPLGDRWPDVKDNTDEVIARATSYEEAVAMREQYGDYLGALAVSCAKAGKDPNALIGEFASITGIDPGDQGCNCCGPPHDFTWHAPDGTQSSPSVRVETYFDGF